VSSRPEAGTREANPWVLDPRSDYFLHKIDGPAYHVDFIPEDLAGGLHYVPGFVAIAVPLISNRGLTPPRDPAWYAREGLDLYVRMLRRQLERELAQTQAAGKLR
jgi:hypothetical protein